MSVRTLYRSERALFRSDRALFGSERHIQGLRGPSRSEVGQIGPPFASEDPFSV